MKSKFLSLRQRWAQQRKPQEVTPQSGVHGELARAVESTGGDFSQSTFVRHATLLGDPRMSQPTNAQQQAMIVQKLQRDYGNQYVQRLVKHVTEFRTAQGNGSPESSSLIQVDRDEGQDDPDQISPDVVERIQSRQGAGRPLEADTRAEMESAFGQDFSDVRVHTGSEANDLNQAMQARAFTTGSDVFFGQGNYAPDTSEGKETLAHELTHVMQQEYTNGIGQIRRQRKKQRGKNRPPKPLLLKPDDYRLEVQNGEEAVKHFNDAASKAKELYDIMTSQAISKTIHKHHTKAYTEAKETLRKLNEKSDFAKVLEGIMTIVDFSISIATVVGAARTVLKSAKSFKNAYESYKESKGRPIYGFIVLNPEEEKGRMLEAAKETGKTGVKLVKAGKGAYDLGKKIIPGDDGSFTKETLLPDVNAAAIEASNAALDRLTEGDIRYKLLDVHQIGTDAALDLAQMTVGIELLGRSGKVIPTQGLEELERLINNAVLGQKEYEDRAKQLKQLWEAYEAGGAMAIADPKERSLFGKIAAWKRAGDPKADALHFALDQELHDVFFMGIRRQRIFHAFSGVKEIYYCHEFDQDKRIYDRGILYISDPTVEKELKKDLRSLFWYQVKGGGFAQQKMDPKYKDASRYRITISGAKALYSLGVMGTYFWPAIFLYNNGDYKKQISKKHMGQWFDSWWDEPEFEEFWHSELGAKYGYLWDKDKKRRIVLSAADKKKLAESYEEVLDVIESPYGF